MGRRSDHSRDEIRAMAIAAAEGILTRQGVAGLSTRKVAAKIGYTVGTLYLAFKNLDDIVLHINSKTLDKLSQVLEDEAARCQQPEFCIKTLGRAYCRFAEEQSALWSLLFEYQYPDDLVLPKWYEEKIAHLFTIVENKLEVISPGRSQTELKQAACALWSGVHGICVLSHKNKLAITGNIPTAVLTDSLIENYLIGYLSSDRGKQHA